MSLTTALIIGAGIGAFVIAFTDWAAARDRHRVKGATSTMRGHEIRFIRGSWRYLDGSPADDSRPCVRCGRLPDAQGHDACLGSLPGVKSACCGHGVSEAYAMPALRQATRLGETLTTYRKGGRS